MKKFLCLAAVAALLAACDSRSDDEDPTDPATPTDPTTPTEPTTPSEVDQNIANNLGAFTFDPATDSLQVTLTGLDGDTVATTYTRDSQYDVGPNGEYQAYTQQDDPLDRFYTALGRVSADGTSQAVVAMDGGQFNRFYGGASYEQIGAYSAPESGLASYAGTYAGLINIGTLDGVPTVPGSEVNQPARAGRVSGEVFMNVSFSENLMNGSITNRVDEDGLGVTLGDVIFAEGTLNNDGYFSGIAEDNEKSGIGSFAGVLGGEGATSMSGGVHLDGDFISSVEDEKEYGIFVIDQCGTAGASAAICAGVDDVDE